MKIDFKRRITHYGYEIEKVKKIEKYSLRIEKIIHCKPKQYKEIFSPKYYTLNDNNFIVMKCDRIGPLMIYGGLSLAAIIMFSFVSDDEKYAKWAIIITAFFVLVFQIVYYITQPKKQHILNRRDGLITMSGVFWNKNITMPFNKVEFCYSAGEDAFVLRVARPEGGNTFEIYSIFGHDCYEDIAFIVWYMDKNRPLPPMDIFDEYRKEDYARRKSEGFPKPLYPSNISTPEATKEQQRERERIGGW